MEMSVARATPDEQDSSSKTGRTVHVVARFVLPKGGYATTVLGRACRLIDVAGRRQPDDDATDIEEP